LKVFADLTIGGNMSRVEDHEGMFMPMPGFADPVRFVPKNMTVGELTQDPNGIQFTVLGVPQPQGSSKAFIPKGWTRAIITSANAKNKPWRQETASCAINAMIGRAFMDGAVELVVDFYFDRPKSQKKSLYKTTKPDVDKLIRSVSDAMTGIVFRDDSQIVQIISRKAFGSPARAEIQVREL
jgi:Holliday junction resolvase RusA-like endonuclease